MQSVPRGEQPTAVRWAASRAQWCCGKHRKGMTVNQKPELSTRRGLFLTLKFIGCCSYPQDLMGSQPNRPGEAPLHQQENGYSDLVWWQAHFVIYFFQAKATMFSVGALVDLSRCLNKLQTPSKEECWIWEGVIQRRRTVLRSMDSYRATSPFCYILVNFVGRLLPFLEKKCTKNPHQDCLLSLQRNCGDTFFPCRSLEKCTLSILMDSP